MINFQARDVIAGLALIICAYLLISGLDGQVKGMMGFILGYYFSNGQNYFKTREKDE